MDVLDIRSDEEEKEVDPETLFFFHDKEYVFAKKSLYCFTKHNRIRKVVVWIITHKRFD